MINFILGVAVGIAVYHFRQPITDYVVSLWDKK